MTTKLTLRILAPFPPREGEAIEIILTDTSSQTTSTIAHPGTIYEPVFEAAYSVAEVVEASPEWRRGATLAVIYNPLNALNETKELFIGKISFTQLNTFDSNYGTYPNLVEAIGFLLERTLNNPEQAGPVGVDRFNTGERDNRISKVVIIATKPVYELAYTDRVQIQWWQGERLLDEVTITMTGLSISQQLGSEIYFNSNLKSFWLDTNVQLYYFYKETAGSHEQLVGTVEIAGPDEQSSNEVEPDEIVAEIIQSFLDVNL